MSPMNRAIPRAVRPQNIGPGDYAGIMATAEAQAKAEKRRGWLAALTQAVLCALAIFAFLFLIAMSLSASAGVCTSEPAPEHLVRQHLAEAHGETDVTDHRWGGVLHRKYRHPEGISSTVGVLMDNDHVCLLSRSWMIGKAVETVPFVLTGEPM